MANPSVKGTANVSTTTSVTIPSHAVGDLIVIWAFRDGSTTVPSKPSASGTVPAWSDIDSAAGANTCSSRSAYFVATATNHTSGTWTNATGMVAVVIQNQKSSSPIGGHAQGGGTSSTLATAPSITQRQTTGKALILEFYGHRTVTAWSTAPTGYTRQASNATEVCFNTKDSSTSDGSISQNCTTSASSGYRGQTIEILANETSPTVSLSSPSDGGSTSDTTPDLVFTGTDSEGDDIRYNVQIDTANTFDTANLINVGSGTSHKIVQSASNSGSDTATATLSTSPEQGNLLVASVYSSLSKSTVSMSGWTTAAQIDDDSLHSLSVFYKIAGSGESTSVTATSTGSGSTHVAVAEFRGAYTVAALDKTVTNSSVATTVNSLSTGTTATTTKADELLVAAGGIAGSGSSITYTNSFSGIVNTTRVTLGSKTVTSSGTYETTIGFTGTAVLMNAILVTFKAVGTDSGFSGSPDNTDPFASGQQVTYTVQSALSSTTYYWRVRGIDPSGSNTYGSWATTRSFTVSSGTNVSVSSDVVTSTSSVQAPTVTTTSNVSVSANVVTLTSSAQVPTVTTTSNVSVSADVVISTSSVQTPTVTATTSVNTSADVVTCTSSVPTHTITTTKNVTVSADVVVYTSSVIAPVVSTQSSVSVSSEVVSGTLVVIDPQVTTTANTTVTPDTPSISSSVVDPVVSTQVYVSVSSGVVSAYLSPPSVTVSTSSTVDVSVAPNNLSVSLPQPTVTANKNVSIYSDFFSLVLSLNSPILRTGIDIIDSEIYNEQLLDMTGSTNQITESHIYTGEIGNFDSDGQTITSEIVYNGSI